MGDPNGKADNQPKIAECDHSKNENYQIAQTVIDLGGKLLLIISCKCTVCKNVQMTLKEIPLSAGLVAPKAEGSPIIQKS